MSMLSSRTLLARFQEYCRRRHLVGEHAKIIVAVSGGIDSTVLLDILARQGDPLGLSLIVAHFNHQLRGGESDADEEFVATRAKEYGLELYVERAPTAQIAQHAKRGIQETARDLRYEFFQKLLVSSGFDRIATAHNADDNAETVLLNLLRGAGVQGLAGIPVYRSDTKIIRPLLFARRQEISAYADAERIPYRNDLSNEKDYYTRNFIRMRILPLIKDQVNPGIVQTLHRTAELFRELEVYLSVNARQALDLVVLHRTEDALSLSIPRLHSHPVLLQQHVVMLAGESCTGHRMEYDTVNAVLDLTESETGSSVVLSGGTMAYRDRDSLVFRKAEPEPEFRIVIRQNSSYEFDAFSFSSQLLDHSGDALEQNGGAEYVDADRVKATDLILRTWKDGDAFMPLGMTGMKKISDYFIDAKVPVYEKHAYPVLETKDGAVVWLCGQRIDERFKVTADTRHVLKLHFSRTRDKAHGEGHQS